MTDDRMITISEAVKLTQKSESTLYRILKEHTITTEKKREGRTVRKYISYRELMAVLSRDSAHTTINNSLNGNIKTPSNEIVNSRYVNHLEDVIRQLREEIKEQKGKIEKLQDENKALNEEIKGLLRQGQTKKRGIMGYLVEKIMS